MLGAILAKTTRHVAFKDVKRLLFDPQDDVELERGLYLLDRLHNEGTLTDDQRAWLLEKLRKSSLILHVMFRGDLPEPPTPDSFWWFSQHTKETPEEQIAYDMRFEDSYPGYKRP